MRIDHKESIPGFPEMLSCLKKVRDDRQPAYLATVVVDRGCYIRL
jgi:hypothetical protein